MIYQRLPDTGNIDIRLSLFDIADGVKECNAIILGNDPDLGFKTQLGNLLGGVGEVFGYLRQRHPETVFTPVFRRFFLSDPANQQEAVRLDDCATSCVGQAPLSGMKAGLWVYLQSDMSARRVGGNIWEVSHGAYRHLWTAGAEAPKMGNSFAETAKILYDYNNSLKQERCFITNDCLRTWIFVRDIDVNYSGMVKARNQAFSDYGLTSDTHFIASTGIGAMHSTADVSVRMDAYAISGLEMPQTRHLQALTHLNPTYEYGVAFERATSVEYGDRRHVLVSGTASINNKGEVVHEGDVARQADRMFDNIAALLREARCTLDHVAYMLVYLRDSADYRLISRYMEDRFPYMPYIIVKAPVCRPKWLIETECLAIKETDNDDFSPL